jgi:homeobox protein 2
MHRKSIEAAEQLKDDGCSSDKEDQHETSSMTTDKSDNSTNNSSSQQQQQQSQPNQDAAENNNKEIHQHQLRLQELQHQIDHQNHQSSVLQLAHATDPEEFRNNSIACLRAKAQEHSAKILSLSADAVMLVNRGRNGTTSAVNNVTTSAATHCDANANSLTGRQHQGDVILTSSDTSSSMF